MRVRLGLCVMLSAACGAPISFTPTGDSSRSTQPRGPAQVDVFTKGGPVRPNVEIGTIEATRDGDDKRFVSHMREYAAEHGCDALVIPAGEEAKQTSRASCVVYTAAPLMQPPPPPTATGSNAPNACIPNSPQPCYGPGGCRGNQTCTGDGKSFTPCDCAGSH